MKLEFLTEERIKLTDFFILANEKDAYLCCAFCNNLVFKDLKLEKQDYTFECYACYTTHFLNKQLNIDSNIYFIKHILI